MNNRILRLVFKGNIELFKPINTSIPQGSPISPILFLIYIQDLFKSNSIKFLSYIDNILLIVSSKSFKQNIKILEQETKVLFELSTKYVIKFDIDKTELIYFNSGKKQLYLVLPNRNIVLPIKLVKWLGIHFDYNLKFKEHIAIRTSLAKQVLYCINRLVNISRGLSPFAIRQLYLACITSVADYGSELWWDNNKSIRPLQAIQNLATRKILGVFKTAPLLPMQLESALPPVIIRLNHKLRCYTLRALKLSQNHPIKIEIDCAIELVSEKRASPGPNSKTTQKRTKIHFERLVESIFDLTNLKNLEYINHFYFTPWDKKVDFNIRILDQSKEKEAINHLKYLESICNTNTVSIYIDGLQMTISKRLKIGLSFAVYKHNTSYILVEPIYTEY